MRLKLCFAPALLAGLFVLSPSVHAQSVERADGLVVSPGEEVRVPAPPAAIENSWIVRFDRRSFDLEPLERAIRARDTDRAAAVVDDMEAAVQRDQARFVAAAQRLGGRVVQQWWIINGACVEGVTGEQAAGLPGVVSVEPNWIYEPVNNTARNSSNHDAESAEQTMNASGQLVRGQGLAIAVLDTGSDADFAGTGLPSPALFPGGSQSNATGPGIGGSRLLAALNVASNTPEDFQGHGSHVTGIAGSAFAGYRGIARDTSIVAVKINLDDMTGSASATALTTGWQRILEDRLTYGIAVANNSYSGSPSLASATQTALDNSARIGDILICCAAGNDGNNTATSQNVWNGLAVGAIRKNTWTVPGFSGRGPLDGFNRTYPDIAGIGVNVLSMRPDNANGRTLSGTSMASPMVAGGAALVRSADPSLSALETKAILLNTTQGPQNDRNARGLGVMDCSAAVDQALAGDWYTTFLSDALPTRSRTFTVASTTDLDLTAVWMRDPDVGALVPNVDLRVFEVGSATPVASDLNTNNSYEHVDFTAQAGSVYTLELTWTNPLAGESLTIAIAGLPDVPQAVPTIATLSSDQLVQNGGVTEFTITGTDLGPVSAVELDGSPVGTWTPYTESEGTWTVEGPVALGSYLLTVRSDAGASASVPFSIVPPEPIVLEVPAITPTAGSLEITLYGRATDTSVLFLSPSSLPSVFPGLIDLGIGDNFGLLFEFATLSHDPVFGVASLSVPVPSFTGGAILLYYQAITVDSAAPVVPLRTSTVGSGFLQSAGL